jgi:hypothetical protein
MNNLDFYCSEACGRPPVELRSPQGIARKVACPDREKRLWKTAAFCRGKKPAGRFLFECPDSKGVSFGVSEEFCRTARRAWGPLSDSGRLSVIR